jgi:large subunit ribosomal protein L25
VEALPNDIPEAIEHDVSHMEMLATEHLSDVTAPPNVTFKDDLEIVVASITPPRVEEEPDEIESETGVVGEGGEPVAEGEAAEGGDEGAAEDASSGGDE